MFYGESNLGRQKGSMNIKIHLCLTQLIFKALANLKGQSRHGDTGELMMVSRISHLFVTPTQLLSPILMGEIEIQKLNDFARATERSK